MSGTLDDRRKAELEHAQWRVTFYQSLLDVHRNSRHPGKEWTRKEFELLDALTRAQGAVDLLQTL